MSTEIEVSIESTLDALDTYCKKARYRDLFTALGTIANRDNPATAGEIAHAAGYCAPAIYRPIERLTTALIAVGSPFRVRSKRINRQSHVYWLGIEK